MSRRRRGNSGILFPAMIIISLVVGVGGVISYFSKKSDPKVDLVTYCPLEEGITKQSIFFLLDTTQQLSATQERLIQDIFYQVIRAAQGYDRIAIFEVDLAQENLLQPLFEYCKPVGNKLGDPILEKFKERNFKRRLQAYFDSAVYDRPTSPIIGAIGSVAASFPIDNSVRHLIIASDFIENSSLMNQYHADWKTRLDVNPKPIYDKQPRLEGVDVSLLFIPRPKVRHQNQDFADWWIHYLEESGANVTQQEFYNPDSGHRYDLDPFIPITG